MMRQSHTAVLARNETWSGSFATEPYEAAWASEAILFLRLLEPTASPLRATAKVQISPDGMAWCDEGTTLGVPVDPATPTFARVRHFGGFLRIAGAMPPGAEATVIAYLTLKE